MRIQRLQVSALPSLPSERRSWWGGSGVGLLSSASSNRFLSYTETILCVLLGISTGLMFRSQDCLTAVFTTLIGLTLPMTLWLFDLLSCRQVLATKTFFTDFPVHGIASLEDDLFAISGGGGGLSYGIPDQCAIVALKQKNPTPHNTTTSASKTFQRPPVGSLAFHVINNSNTDVNGREELQKLDLAILQSLTPHSFWGLAASSGSGLLCGGVAGIFHVFRIQAAATTKDREADNHSSSANPSGHPTSHQTLNPNTPGTKPPNTKPKATTTSLLSNGPSYALLGDALGRCLIPVGSHTLIEQPFSSKKKLFIHRSTVQDNKIAVLTEDNQLAYYIVLNDFLCLVAIAGFQSNKILAIHFDSRGDNLLVLTADHRLLQYATPNIPLESIILEGNTSAAAAAMTSLPKSMGIDHHTEYGIADLRFVSDDRYQAQRPIMRNIAAHTWTPISQIKIKDSLNIEPRHLIIVNKSSTAQQEGGGGTLRHKLQTSEAGDTIVLVGTTSKANASQMRTPHATIAHSQLIRVNGESSLQITDPWTYKVLKNIGGCPAVAVSDQYLTVVGNKKFVVLDKHTLAIKQAYDRHDLDTPADNTLPVTAADISKNEKYLLVGTADYSVVVAPLACPPARWLEGATTSSGKILDYFKTVVKVSSLTIVLAFLMT